MKLGTKAQSAMEYLMTYGWAILVVMVVGIVMWQLGIFQMGTTTVTSTGFTRLKPQLAAIKLTATNQDFEGIFTNGAGTTIYFLGGVIDETSTGSGIDCTVGSGSSGALGDTVSAGNNFKITGTGCGTSSLGAGDIYTLDVDLSYGVVIGGIGQTHVDHGTLRGPVES